MSRWALNNGLWLPNVAYNVAMGFCCCTGGSCSLCEEDNWPGSLTVEVEGLTGWIAEYNGTYTVPYLDGSCVSYAAGSSGSLNLSPSAQIAAGGVGFYLVSSGGQVFLGWFLQLWPHDGAAHDCSDLSGVASLYIPTASSDPSLYYYSSGSTAKISHA